MFLRQKIKIFHIQNLKFVTDLVLSDSYLNITTTNKKYFRNLFLTLFLFLMTFFETYNIIFIIFVLFDVLFSIKLLK